jgi:hypothetical protein
MADLANGGVSKHYVGWKTDLEFLAEPREKTTSANTIATRGEKVA